MKHLYSLREDLQANSGILHRCFFVDEVEPPPYCRNTHRLTSRGRALFINRQRLLMSNLFPRLGIIPSPFSLISWKLKFRTWS